MDELKQFFGADGAEAITFEQLTKGLSDKGMKLADLSLGGYVGKDKFDDLQRRFTDYKSKNDVSKYADYDTIKAERDALKAAAADAEFMGKLATAKVKSEFQKFVLAEVKAAVTDKKDFDAALAEYIKTNPQYLEVEPKKGFTKNSSNPLSGGSGEEKTINAKMNEILRGAKG